MNRTKLFVWVSALFIAGLVYSQTRVVTDPQTFIDELLASVLSPESPPPLNLPLVASNAVPESATFWSAQANEDSPPYPFNPVADLGLPVYSLGQNSFLFDDRAVNYVAWNQVQATLRQLASGMTMDSLDFPPEGEGTNENGGWTNNFVSPVYTTNDLWLEWLAESVTNGTGTIAPHIPESYGDAAWDLFATTNLSVNTEADALNVTNWLWLARTTAAQTNLTVNFIWSAEAYFRLAATNDYDADGLTDAFETLVSHSNASTNDTDGDGLLDAWEWTHFGNFAQTDTGDYDNDSTDNLAEQTAGSDPNTLVFTLSVTNTHVNGAATVTADLTGGVPYAFAVMVDATNFTAPNWYLYASSNLYVDLGATDGWHDVWVALRGRVPTNHVNWQWQHLKRDTIAPTLTLTNPTPTTSWPLIQVQGLSDEDLAEISYTLGTVTNERVFVLDRHYATNTHEFTTNRFQAFDVELAEGTNTFSLRATDLAGNVTATNFPFILAPDTTAPTLRLTWPQPGALIGADTVTVRGWLDDPTARVTAALVGTNGVTNVYPAVVERHGRFWLEHLPLPTGTNRITLTAVDAWTNTMTTNFNVVRSSVQVVITPPTSDLWASCVNVSGTVSDASHSVWVNGGPATMDGTNWTACVNVGSGGVAGVSASAYPPGGEPSGGGGSGGGEENPSNPPGSGSVTAELQLDKPARFYVESYFSNTDYRHQEDYSGYSEVLQTWVSSHHDEASASWVSWQDGAGGSGGWLSSWSYESSQGTNDTGSVSAVQSWLASRWPELVAGQQVVTEDEASTTNSTPAPVVLMEHCDVAARLELADGGWQYRFDHARQADAVVKLFTGGRSVAKAKTLWELTGSATEILDPWAEPPYGSEVPTRSIPPEQLKWGGLGQLAADGKRFEQLPDGNVVNAKIESTRNQYTFQTSGNPLGLKLESVTFLGDGYYPIRIDTNGSDYTTPHWLTNRSHPALYVSGFRLEADTTFKLRPSGAASTVIVQGVASVGAETEAAFTLWATNATVPFFDYCTVRAIADTPFPTNTVDFHNKLKIKWSYAVTNDADKFYELSASENQIYVSWKMPQTTRLFHTVIDVACRNATGQTVESNIVAGIWGNIAGRNVLKADGSGPMKYWGPISTSEPTGLSTFELVQLGDGRCGGWANFFRDALAVHGIASESHSVLPPPSFSSIIIYSNLAAQGGTPLKNEFPSHATVSVGTNLFDPSYGKLFTNEVTWEDFSVDAFGQPSTPDIKGGAPQTIFDPRFDH